MPDELDQRETVERDTVPAEDAGTRQAVNAERFPDPGVDRPDAEVPDTTIVEEHARHAERLLTHPDSAPQLEEGEGAEDAEPKR